MRSLLIVFFLILYISDISAQTTVEPFTGVPPVYLATPFSKNVERGRRTGSSKKKKSIVFFLDAASAQMYNLNDELDANFFMQGVSARLHILSKVKVHTEIGANYFIPMPYRQEGNGAVIRSGSESNYGFHLMENYFFEMGKDLVYLSQGFNLAFQKIDLPGEDQDRENANAYYTTGVGYHFHKAFFFEARFMTDFLNQNAIMLNLGYRLKVKIRLRK